MSFSRGEIQDLDVTLIVQTAEPLALTLDAPAPVILAQGEPNVILTAGHQGPKGNAGSGGGISEIDIAYLHGLFAGLVNDGVLERLQAEIPRISETDKLDDEILNKQAIAMDRKFQVVIGMVQKLIEMTQPAVA